MNSSCFKAHRRTHSSRVAVAFADIHLRFTNNLTISGSTLRVNTFQDSSFTIRSRASLQTITHEFPHSRKICLLNAAVY